MVWPRFDCGGCTKRTKQLTPSRSGSSSRCRTSASNRRAWARAGVWHRSDCQRVGSVSVDRRVRRIRRTIIVTSYHGTMRIIRSVLAQCIVKHNNYSMAPPSSAQPALLSKLCSPLLYSACNDASASTCHETDFVRPMRRRDGGPAVRTSSSITCSPLLRARYPGEKSLNRRWEPSAVARDPTPLAFPPPLSPSS